MSKMFLRIQSMLNQAKAFVNFGGKVAPQQPFFRQEYSYYKFLDVNKIGINDLTQGDRRVVEGQVHEFFTEIKFPEKNRRAFAWDNVKTRRRIAIVYDQLPEETCILPQCKVTVYSIPLPF